MGWYHSAYPHVRRDRRRRDDRPSPPDAHVRHLSVRPELTAGTATVVISGELDLLAAPSLAAHLEQILSGRPQRLVLDLARVSFIDCAAARVIAGPEGSLPGGQRPVIRRPSPVVRRVLELTGLDGQCELESEPGDRLGRQARRRRAEPQRSRVHQARRGLPGRQVRTASGRGDRTRRPPVRRAAAGPFGGRARRRTPGAGSVGARGRHAGHFRAGRRTPGRRGDDGERHGAADIRAGRTARAYLESAARQSGPGPLRPAGPGLRPATGPARLGRGPAGRRPGRAGGRAAAAGADAEGASGNRDHAVLRHDHPGHRGRRRRAAGRAGTREGHRDGTPGRSAGAGRAPRMAVRTARRGRLR